MQKKISPLPWEQEGLWIKDAGLDCIVRCLNALDGDTDANAAFIVKACNSHLDLVNALKDAQAFIAGDTLSDPMLVAGQLASIDAALAKAEAK